MKESPEQWAMSVRNWLRNGSTHGTHLPSWIPSELDLSQWLPASQCGCTLPSTLHVIHSKILYFIFYLLLSKDTLTKSALSPANPVIVKQSTNPRAILVTFIVPDASEYLTILNYCYFLKNNSTPPSEFHFRILVLLLFLALFLFPS